jgi:hypothetical protein
MMNLKEIIGCGKLYVYDKQEVTLTGRKATKRVKDVFKPGGGEITDTLLEVQPVDLDVHWKVFVRLEDLYEISKDV